MTLRDQATELSALVNQVTDKLYEAHNIAQEAASALNKARYELAAKKSEILRTHDPKDLGSNEAQRNAAIDAIVADEIGNVYVAETNVRNAQHGLTLAQLDFDATKLQVRLLEAASRFAGVGE